MMTDAEKAFRYFLQMNSERNEDDDGVRAEAFAEALQLFDELMGPNPDQAAIRKGASGYDRLHSGGEEPRE
jgi:hypothetical protein